MELYWNLESGNQVIVNIYIENDAVYYYPQGFHGANSRIRIHTFEDFQNNVRNHQNIEMQFDLEKIAKAYGEIEDPLKGLLSRLFDASVDYEKCKQGEANACTEEQKTSCSKKTDEAKTRFLSVCRAISHLYNGTPEKSPLLQELYRQMNAIHQEHFGTV